VPIEVGKAEKLLQLLETARWRQAEAEGGLWIVAGKLLLPSPASRFPSGPKLAGGPSGPIRARTLLE
jgi:hypothetical protein